MNVEKKRIFISDLPETASQTEIGNVFKSYGNVQSVEIKERKELGVRNTSLFFAYVNIETDDRNLQQCFKDFANKKWHGQYILLQIARESFLERLKREREESEINKNNVNTLEEADHPEQKVSPNIINGFHHQRSKIYKSSESDSVDSDSSETKHVIKPNNISVVKTKNKISKQDDSSENETVHIDEDVKEPVDLIIKNNKGKIFNQEGLKIESVGNKPILKINISKKKEAVNNNSEANLRRLQSLSNLKKGYKTQKSLIQSALSKIDSNTKNKIIFDDSINSRITNKLTDSDHQKKKSLFDGADDEEEFEANFTIKEQFLGKEGQKLLKLQSKYKNDKRFVLDKRFLGENKIDDEEIVHSIEANEEISLEEEKRKEYEILGEILGQKVGKTWNNSQEDETTSRRKFMQRYDPTLPEHSKFELKEEVNERKVKKRRRKDSDVIESSEKKQEEREAPSVSKEIFYKVTDDLKESLHDKKDYSLLSMFGRIETEEEQGPINEKPIKLNRNTIINNEKNPFRYDSSEDEGAAEDSNNKEIQQIEKPAVQKTSHNFWSEPFFFKEDDYRLQEGFDFIEKMKVEEKTEFTKLRRDLKEIVKAKVRNNHRKHKPFKKKLGGSRQKKMIRMKKALKR